MTLPQARLLIERCLPEPKRQLSYVLILVEYHTRRNYQAYQSHRKRRMKELKKWKSLKTSLYCYFDFVIALCGRLLEALGNK